MAAQRCFCSWQTVDAVARLTPSNKPLLGQTQLALRKSFLSAVPRVSLCPREDRAVRRVYVRALEVSGPGAIDSPLMTSMREKIMTALETQDVVVTDTQGDGRHVSIEVVSPLFEGKRSVERQRLVYKAIWEELQDVVHAVDSMTTKSPSEVS